MLQAEEIQTDLCDESSQLSPEATKPAMLLIVEHYTAQGTQHSLNSASWTEIKTKLTSFLLHYPYSSETPP